MDIMIAMGAPTSTTRTAPIKRRLGRADISGGTNISRSKPTTQSSGMPMKISKVSSGATASAMIPSRMIITISKAAPKRELGPL